MSRTPGRPGSERHGRSRPRARIQAILVAVLSGVDTYGGRGRIALVILAVAAMQQVQTGINMALGRWPGANFAAEFGWGVLLIAVLGLSQRLGDGTRRPGWRFWSRERGADVSGGGTGVKPEESVDVV